MKLRVYIVMGMLFVLLMSSLTESRRGKSGRRKSKTRTKQNSRFLFYTNPRRKEYYDNPNVSLLFI